MEVPRTTDRLAGYGVRVPKDELLPGDIVFFRTGYKTRHVGIYLEKGRFMHSSKSSGVTISSMSSRYWSRRYLQARRIPGLH
jgi:cell wall-associated NlpC family hydrolase